MNILKVKGKLAGMRKEQEFVVYKPYVDPDTGTTWIKVQSDRAIGRFNAGTGVGVLNWKGSNYKYNVHLSPLLGAEPYTFPTVFVAACIIAQPESGDRIGPNVYWA